MPRRLNARTRKLTVIAQDSSIKKQDAILRTQLDIAAERLSPGPCGHRVQVIDFDASSGTHYEPAQGHLEKDSFARAGDEELLTNPHFHAQNVYAIAMHTLARFEAALGRRVAWSFQGHQLKIAPHAFADSNAFYSERDQALMFGYFKGRSGNMVFTCLSHDVVAHETSHALLDGLRTRYTDPSSPDQAAFHEGFADVVAILSGFAQQDVFEYALTDFKMPGSRAELIASLKGLLLAKVGKEFGNELRANRGKPLRTSLELTPEQIVDGPEFKEPHRRGEVLVAAMLNTMIQVWVARATAGAGDDIRGVNVQRVLDEGPKAADHLLTAAIRALDYAPPVDLQFGDYLSALLTADAELWPDDGTYRYRTMLLDTFKAYGIEPAGDAKGGLWAPPDISALDYDGLHFDSLKSDPDEVFRFVWQNRKPLELREGVFTRVMSVRPCVRVASDGFTLRETVADYLQVQDLRGSELRDFGVAKPSNVKGTDEVTLYGGGALIFDEFGKLKHHVYNHVDSPRQTSRLAYLADRGELRPGQRARRFASMHMARMMGATPRVTKEGW